MDIPYEKQFHFRDGTAVGSLEQLKAKIESISYQEFYHHVNTQKNDFASWVQYVIKDAHLAEDLHKVTSIVETVEVINDYLHPRPITAQRKDAQSLIEADVFSSPMASEFSGRDGRETMSAMTIEDVPTIVPAQAPRTGAVEPLDFTIIEEKINSSEHERANAAAIGSDDMRSDGKMRDELFGVERKTEEEFAANRSTSTFSSFAATQSASQAGSQAAQAGQGAQAASVAPHAVDDGDATRLILKDFMIGFVSGLVLGLIIARIIA